MGREKRDPRGREKNKQKIVSPRTESGSQKSRRPLEEPPVLWWLLLLVSECNGVGGM